MEGPVPIPLETLLAHREWVRRVALALVRDENLARDLEQDLWVKALERPPVVRGSVRGWIAASLRSAFIDRFRSESSRRRRERGAARPDRQRSTADVVAEADGLKRVVVSVMALEEPYRSTVLLRYFEDLPPREIAARQGVPVETVRTRLKRAVAALRERFDREHGGDREAWVAALLPLTEHDPRETPAPTTGAAASGALAGAAGAATVMGGLLMSMKASAAAVAVGAVLGAGLLWGGQKLLAPTPSEEATTKAATHSAPGTAGSGRAAVPAAKDTPTPGSPGGAPTPPVVPPAAPKPPAGPGVILRIKHPEGVAPRNVRVQEFVEEEPPQARGGGKGGRGGKRGGGGGGAGRAYSWSVGHPFISLTPGTHRLLVTDGEYLQFRGGPITVEVSESGPPEEREVVLAEEPGLRISVEFPGGKDIPGLVVSYLRAEGDVEPDERAVLRSNNALAYSPGRDIVQSGLEPGRYVVAASADRERALAREVVEVGQGTTRVVLRPVFGDDMSVEVRLLGPEGRPLPADAFKTFLGWRTDDGNYSGTGARLVEVGPGRYRLPIPVAPSGTSPGAPPKPGSWELGLASAEWGVRRLPVRHPSPDGITVAFEEPAVLEVEIEGYAGSGLEGSLLVFIEGDGSDPVMAGGMHRFRSGGRPNDPAEKRGVPSEEGVAVLPGLPSGEAEVLVAAITPETGGFCRPILAKRVTLAAGKNRVRLALPALHRLVVEGEGFSSGQQVWLSSSRVLDRARSPKALARADAEGKVAFEQLSAGDYLLLAYQDRELREMLVRVEGSMSVRFQPAPATVLVVTSVEPGGLLQRLGFRAGDRIVSAGGLPLASSESLEKTLSNSRLSGEKTLAIGVERGGGNATIDVDPGVFYPGRADFNVGGAVEAVLR